MDQWMPWALDIMAMVETWARVYSVSRLAIMRQIPIAYSWAKSNPKKAPKKYVLRFLHSWMRSAQRHGNLVDKPVDRRYNENPVEQDMTFEEMQEIRRINMGTVQDRREAK